MLAGLPEELQRRARKKGEPQDVVVEAVDAAAIEKIIRGMRLDEETLPSVCKAEIHGAMDGATVPGHPKIVVGFREAPDLVVAQRIVLRQDDLDVIAADFLFLGQPEDDVRKTTDFGDRCDFRGDVHDEHRRPLRMRCVLRFRLRRSSMFRFVSSLGFRYRRMFHNRRRRRFRCDGHGFFRQAVGAWFGNGRFREQRRYRRRSLCGHLDCWLQLRLGRGRREQARVFRDR